jgi:hypothetical protein
MCTLAHCRAVCRYALTKLCNVWYCRHLAERVLAGTGGKVVANVVTPGFIPATGVSDFVVTLCWSGCLGLQPGVTHMTLSLAYLTTSPPPLNALYASCTGYSHTARWLQRHQASSPQQACLFVWDVVLSTRRGSWAFFEFSARSCTHMTLSLAAPLSKPYASCVC